MPSALPPRSNSTERPVPDRGAGPHPMPKIDPRFCCFRLVPGPSKIEGWGVYAGEAIPARRKVIEYTGEKINRRESKHSQSKYLFTLDSYWTVDGCRGGSGAEFINHSCDPNLETWILKGHILYMSLRRIQKGE